MHSARKISIMQRITIIQFLVVCIPVSFIFLFLRYLPMLNFLFVNYVNSGYSIFFPFLPYTIIVFNFTTSHLIDIVIIANIIAFVERTVYQYYMNVCLKKTFLELHPELSFLETYGMYEESSQDSNLILRLKKNTWSLVNECSSEKTFDQKCRIKTVFFSSKNGYRGRLFKNNHYLLNFLYDSNKKFFLPSKKNVIVSNFFENYHQGEGR